MDYTGLRVLILEDDKQQTDVYEQIFDKLGIETLSTNNIHDMERLIKTFHPKILLVDLRLDTDPFDSLAGLKVKNFFDPSSCIVCSGLIDNKTVSRCNDEGFFMIIEKPATEDKIVKCLNMLWSLNQAKSGLTNMLDDKYRTLQEQEIILNSMNAGAYIKDREFKYKTVNSAFLEMLGKTRDQVIGKTDIEIVSNSYKAEKFKMQDLHILKSKEPLMDIIEFTNFNNKPRWTSTFKSPYLNSNGDVEEIIGLVVDITSLVEVKQLFDVTFDAILDGIIIIDENFVITHCNEVIKTWYSDKLPIVGKRCMDVFDCDRQTECIVCRAKKTFRDKSVEQVEKKMKDRWYDLRYYPIVPNGKTTAVVITQRDIHGVKIREEKLEYRIKLERMLVKLSSLFSGLRSEDIDIGINQSLEEIANFFDLPVICVFQLSEDKRFLYKSHHHHSSSLSLDLKVGDFVEIECIGSKFLRILDGETIISNIDDPDIPPSLSCLMKDSQMSSSLMIPITKFGSHDVIGFICADNATQFSWDTDIVGVFQMIGEIFASAITRRMLEDELSKEREARESEIEKDLLNWQKQSKKNQDQTKDNIDVLSTMLNEVAKKGRHA